MAGPLWLGDEGRDARGSQMAGEWEELPDGALALAPTGNARLREKPVDALLAGAVPVYEGDPGVADWLDPRGMVNCAGHGVEEIADRIREAERAGVG